MIEIANTLALLKSDAVIGVKGIFQDNTLTSVGLTCALCHTVVDNSLIFGVGHRLDGWANHDLNAGAIVASAPNLQPIADFLGVTVDTVKTVLNSWGPGKFDAEVFLDGKAFNPQQVSHGVVTGTNVPGAVLIPNSFGLAGFNNHTWTGAWGTVTYWDAFVANIGLNGKGRFFDPRLNDAAQFPIAASHNLGNLPHIDPDEDPVTKRLPSLQFYQLAIPAPRPQPGRDFDPPAAERGDELFSGTAKCNNCHVEPLWTEPGWNLHTPASIGIDSFAADRAPDHVYKTANLAGLFVRENGLFMRPSSKGRFFHDGRFATLLDVVNHYNIHFNLGLTDQEKQDLVEITLVARMRICKTASCVGSQRDVSRISVQDPIQDPTQEGYSCVGFIFPAHLFDEPAKFVACGSGAAGSATYHYDADWGFMLLCACRVLKASSSKCIEAGLRIHITPGSP